MGKLDELRAEGLTLAPWHLHVEIAPGLTTEHLYRESEQSETFIDPGPPLKALFTKLYPDGLDGRSVIDCACNNGAYLFSLKEIGAGRCFGLDAREHWIDQARFLLEHRDRQSDDMEFEVRDLYQLPDRGLAPFNIGIFAGIFYHLPDPMRGLQIAADLTKEVLYVSSATRSGYPDDLLVANHESTDLPLSGVHGLAWHPTGPNVLARMLRWMGFPDVRCLRWWTPPGAGEGCDVVQLVAAREKGFLRVLEEQHPAGRAGMVMRIEQSIRPGATLLVVRPQDDEPVEVPDREVWDFPEPQIEQLDSLPDRGAEYLVVPSSAFAWLDENPELKSELELRFPVVVRDATSCIVYDLGATSA